MSYSTSFYSLKLEDLKSLIGSKNEDLKEKLIDKNVSGSAQAELMKKTDDESDESFNERVKRQEESDKRFAEDETKTIIKIIDEGSIDGSDHYPAYMLEFVDHKRIDDSWNNQAYWDLIEKLVTNPKVDQELTDFLSYITEGRRVTDGERFHQTGDQSQITVGYWTLEETKKIKELLNTVDQTSLEDLARVIQTLITVCEKSIEKNEDVFFVSA